MARNELLSRSFMLMSFAAAAFLVVTQWQTEPDLAADEASATTVVAPMEQAAYAAETPASTASSPTTASPTVATASAPSTRSLPQMTPGLSSTLPKFLVADLPRLVVDLSDRKVYLYKGEELQTTYAVGIGQPGWETPIGNFHINHMQTDPIWQHPITGQTIAAGPDNPLGSRWIGFWTSRNYEIGFHGTNQPETVGKAISHGCLRMHEADVRALYEQVKVGTLVTVRQ
ncbi:L,D-transpeptidase family protein [Oscillatoria sp. FACHB-1407]|uniref:L,D-transpeptidase n=1 Tax=Oscillatoria sp. FACHB-1407 TaxID=2692847 RepID=UPI0016898CA6|nr:L,D-transpeptidase [Oscillatoria sp. FACHB-1407]MBD2464205.1 L,D-transpeptidase family protein [Oscillatoria sp. FACHB-1407]